METASSTDLKLNANGSVMKNSNRIKLLLIDALGCMIASACLTTAVWYGWHRTNEASQELGQWRRVVELVKHDVAQERTRRNQLRATINDRKLQLESLGQLPDRFPLEEYFQVLSQIAYDHKVEIVQQSPMPAQVYPGLLEQRSQLHVVASLPNLIMFLRNIEELDYWGDVSYLKMVKAPAQKLGGASKPSATFTISMFSSRKEPQDKSAEAS